VSVDQLKLTPLSCIDVYSFAVTVWEMFAMIEPYAGMLCVSVYFGVIHHYRYADCVCEKSDIGRSTFASVCLLSVLSFEK
jgi:hypothetical protein